ncbi:MAG: Nif3-like dinuclear metal center hexameric protein [Mycoplasmatales bacterium]|nr:Nif3-like dinuclear metal center hexameric protein [Mycoplasmatales bacterium]
MLNKKITVKTITNTLEEIFPLKLAEEWDKVGIQIGDSKKSVENIIVAMEITLKVVDFAIQNKADLIIIFHPFLFNESDFGTTPKQPWKRKLFKRLIKSGITVYSMHTAFDKEPKGMRLAMLRKLGLVKGSKQIKGLEYGSVIKWGKTLGQLTQLFEEKLKTSITLTNMDKKSIKINKFAFIPGSGSIEGIQTAWKENEVDLVITSDIKWSEWMTINEENIFAMEVSHIVEDVFTEHIYGFLKKNYKNINVKMIELESFIKKI